MSRSIVFVSMLIWSQWTYFLYFFNVMCRKFYYFTHLQKNQGTNRRSFMSFAKVTYLANPTISLLRTCTVFGSFWITDEYLKTASNVKFFDVFQTKVASTNVKQFICW